MIRTIEITVSAQRNLEQIFDYLENRWSTKVRINFAKKLFDTFVIIKIHPESFPNSEIKKDIHKCVITKQITVFYKFNTEKITIVSIFDTRQHPAKIRKDLN